VAARFSGREGVNLDPRINTGVTHISSPRGRCMQRPIDASVWTLRIPPADGTGHPPRLWGIGAGLKPAPVVRMAYHIRAKRR
jgi:hypothetical protein